MDTQQKQQPNTVGVSGRFLIINKKRRMLSRRKWYFIDDRCIGRKCFYPSMSKETPTCITAMMRCGCQIMNEPYSEQRENDNIGNGWLNYR